MKKKTTTLHFSIDGGWLTNHIRNLWMEGSYGKAFRTLEAGFPTMRFEIRCDIIAGRSRMQGVNEVVVVPDTWKPDTKRCAYGHYPEPLEIPALCETLLKDKAELQKLREAELWREKETYQEDDDEHVGRSMIARGEAQLHMANQIAQLTGVPTLDQFVNTQLDRDKRASKGFPKADPTCASEHGGWILPNGKFFGCESAMEHVWLAMMLGKEEADAEALGWVKISTGMLGTYILKGKQDPTQAQINTVFDWCNKHSKLDDLPGWAGGKA